jgi:hypothetical protein
MLTLLVKMAMWEHDTHRNRIVTVTGWYRTTRPIHCYHYRSSVLPHLTYSWATHLSYLVVTSTNT